MTSGLLRFNERHREKKWTWSNRRAIKMRRQTTFVSIIIIVHRQRHQTLGIHFSVWMYASAHTCGSIFVCVPLLVYVHTAHRTKINVPRIHFHARMHDLLCRRTHEWHSLNSFNKAEKKRNTWRQVSVCVCVRHEMRWFNLFVFYACPGPLRLRLLSHRRIKWSVIMHVPIDCVSLIDAVRINCYYLLF